MSRYFDQTVVSDHHLDHSDAKSLYGIVDYCFKSYDDIHHYWLSVLMIPVFRIEIHYKKSGNYVFFCVASKDTKKRLCWSFIDDLDSTFAAVTRKNDIKGNRKMIKQKVVGLLFYLSSNDA